MVPVNYAAVVAGGVAAMVVGSFWYSNVGFSKTWTKLIGKSEKDLKESMQDKGKMVKLYGITFVGALVLSYVMARFAGLEHAGTVMDGLKLGLWAWFGFVAAVMVPAYLFEGRPTKLLTINAGYALVNFLLIGAIVAAWH